MIEEIKKIVGGEESASGEAPLGSTTSDRTARISKQRKESNKRISFIIFAFSASVALITSQKTVPLFDLIHYSNEPEILSPENNLAINDWKEKRKVDFLRRNTELVDVYLQYNVDSNS